MLEMAMRLADFTGPEDEELRRALSFHRSDKEMTKVSAKLRAALERKGHAPHVIEGVLTAITSFALYGFPESHAISFAHMAYSSAYLKAHYAPEFYASLLNCQPMGFYSSATLIKDGQRHGVKFLPVCAMQSDWDCTIESVEKKQGDDLQVRAIAGFEAQSLNERQNDAADSSPVRLGLRVVKNLS